MSQETYELQAVSPTFAAPAKAPLFTNAATTSRRMLFGVAAIACSLAVVVIVLSVLYARTDDSSATAATASAAHIPSSFEGTGTFSKGNAFSTMGFGAPQVTLRYNAATGERELVYPENNGNNMNLYWDAHRGAEHLIGSHGCSRRPTVPGLEPPTFHAIAVIPKGVVSTPSGECSKYAALRADGSEFEYSVLATTGAICHIVHNNLTFTFSSFTKGYSFTNSPSRICNSNDSMTLSVQTAASAPSGVQTQSLSVFDGVGCGSCNHYCNDILDYGVGYGCDAAADATGFGWFLSFVVKQLCEKLVEFGCSEIGCCSSTCSYLDSNC